MKLFLWDQRRAHVPSRELLQRAVLQYETAEQNRKNDRESGGDSLFVIGGTSSAAGAFPATGTSPAAGAPLIAETLRGKPFAVHPDGSPVPLQVSVTHTGDWWLCAVGEKNVGIDAELRSRKIRPSVARRICTRQERQWLEECGGDAELFRWRLLRLWVRKEAYVKYLGTGLSQGLNTFSTVEKGREAPGFAAADLSAVSIRAQEELEAAVYSPEEEIEGVEWIRWK